MDRAIPADTELASGGCDDSRGRAQVAVWLAGWGLTAGDLRGTLERVFAHEPTRYLRRIPGRQSFSVVLAGGSSLVIKRYRGEERSEWWHRLLHGLPRRSQARREGENLIALAELGLPVPQALFWVEERSATARPWRGRREAGGRSALAMELVLHREDLRERLARTGVEDHRARARELAQLVARLHRAGWFHRDLYLQHVAVVEREGAPSLVLLDTARARRARAPRRRWLVKDLAALLHSTPDNVSGASRLRWFADYASAAGIRSRREKRAWLRAVLAKRRRIAAHRPRFADPASDPRRTELAPPEGSR
jgi:tRNA A-37 threonylcarbamoyl transferase component Bud32